MPLAVEIVRANAATNPTSLLLNDLTATEVEYVTSCQHGPFNVRVAAQIDESAHRGDEWQHAYPAHRKTI